MNGSEHTNAVSWAGTRVLVTGAAGYIGGHLTEALVGRGADVTAFIRYNSRGDEGSLAVLPPEVRDAVRVVTGDIKDPSAVRSAVAGQEIVFHLAALIGIPYSYVRPADYVQTNVLGTANVLDACHAEGVARLVQTSTSEVYGTALYVPMDEDHPLQPHSPYSASKIGADQLALSYHYSFDLPVTLVRPFNTYGPRQSARAVVPTIICQALSHGRVRLGSVKPTRDFVMVHDTVAAFIAAARTDTTIGEVVNVGTSVETSIGDLAHQVFGILQLDPRIETDAQRLRPRRSEVHRLLANADKARALLGWRPQHDLQAGLRATIDWIRANQHYYLLDTYHI